MLIVEDDVMNTPPELWAVSCPENCEHDISLIISPMLIMSMAIHHQKRSNDRLRYCGNFS